MDETKIEIDFENDKTLIFIYDYLKNSIKATSERWNKFIKKEENQLELSSFLTDKNSFKLVFFTNKDGSIHASKNFPFNLVLTLNRNQYYFLVVFQNLLLNNLIYY